jgi:hypothetical protein
LNKKLDVLLGKKAENDAQSHIKYYSTNNGIGIKEETQF